MSNIKSLAMTAILAAAMHGCASSPPADVVQTQPGAALWVPRSTASFTTVNRSAHYTLIPSDDRDVLLFEDDPRDTGGGGVSRLTWILAVPRFARFDRAIEIGGKKAEAEGWLVEDLAGGPTHVAPLSGQVTIIHKTAEIISATVTVSAAGAQVTPGVLERPEITLARRLDWVYTQPPVPQYREQTTRSGMPNSVGQRDYHY